MGCKPCGMMQLYRMCSKSCRKISKVVELMQTRNSRDIDIEDGSSSLTTLHTYKHTQAPKSEPRPLCNAIRLPGASGWSRKSNQGNRRAIHVTQLSEAPPLVLFPVPPPTVMAEDLQRTLTDLGLEQYLPNCLQAGFHNFQSLSSLTEAELTALGLRLGHRRKLQRKIARDHAWPDNRPLPTSYSELEQHRNRIRGLTRGSVDPDSLKENYYSLATSSPAQSSSPWSREASSSSDSSTSVSNQEQTHGTSLRLTEVLRTGSRLFPIAVSLPTRA
jgi:hypothetical protein